MIFSTLSETKTFHISLQLLRTVLQEYWEARNFSETWHCHIEESKLHSFHAQKWYIWNFMQANAMKGLVFKWRLKFAWATLISWQMSKLLCISFPFPVVNNWWYRRERCLPKQLLERQGYMQNIVETEWTHDLNKCWVHCFRKYGMEELWESESLPRLGTITPTESGAVLAKKSNEGLKERSMLDSRHY